jgi:hypothetical protein
MFLPRGDQIDVTHHGLQRIPLVTSGGVVMGEIVVLVFSAFCGVSFGGCICVAWGAVQ